MEEKVNTKAELIRLFFLYSAISIPVVNSKKEIAGFLSRQDIIASSGMMEDLNIGIQRVIEHHLNTIDRENINSLNLLLQNFSRTKKIPVIDQKGKVVDTWQRGQLISAWEGEEETKYPNLFDKLLVGVVVTDPSGKINYLNPVAASMAVEKGKKKGRNLSEVFPINLEPEPVLNKKVEGLIFDAAPIVDGFIYIIRKAE
jgi:PAS domain-containing protein